MRVILGANAYIKRTRNRQEPIWWDSRTAINAHVLIMGGSGAGKTYTIRHWIESLARHNRELRIHVFDVHGDIDGLPACSSVKFSEQTPYGFNPLALSACRDSGGIRRRIQTFTAALNRTSRRLGTRQEAVLRAVLTDLYHANGFYADKPESWRLDDGIVRRFPKKYPTLLDASRFTQAKLKALHLGADSKAVAALEQVNRKAAALNARLKAMGQIDRCLERGGADAPANSDLERLKAQAIEAYTAFVNAIGSGRELDDGLRYDSRDVLRSVGERLDNLNALGLFRPNPPPFDCDAAVWRYDIKAMREDEQKLFVTFRLEDLFQQAVQRGVQSDVRDLVVLDEAKRFFTEDTDNPLNTWVTEGRKFGLSLICASQSPTHFSEDFLSNVATKLILGIDEMYWDGSVRKLKIDLRTLQYIVPRRTLAAQIKTSGEVRARFVGVDLSGDTLSANVAVGGDP
ncbi:ATP-binding protein [Methyloterricola oryzae]|uniref:ATP-binding protein n=1 Tax=Methyloterricola oryzae TaxID=1495050 RepID=UPI0006998E21|nr:DUF87 domain-containing protein [Methyloterricola oryzae]